LEGVGLGGGGGVVCLSPGEGGGGTVGAFVGLNVGKEEKAVREAAALCRKEKKSGVSPIEKKTVNKQIEQTDAAGVWGVGGGGGGASLVKAGRGGGTDDRVSTQRRGGTLQKKAP